MQIQYYTPLDACVRPDNYFRVIDYLLIAGLHGMNAPNKMHLIVTHAISEKNTRAITDSKFYKVMLVYIDSDPQSPYRKGIFSMDGENIDDAGKIQKIYALLEMNLDDPCRGNITLSPVSFGMDCKPKLSFKINGQLKSLLCVAECILDRTKPMTWSAEEVTDSVCRLHIDMVWFLEEQAAICLKWLEELMVIEKISDDHGGTYKPAMSSQQFQDIFGMRLPEVDPG